MLNILAVVMIPVGYGFLCCFHSVSSIQLSKNPERSLTPVEENSRSRDTFSLLEGIVSPATQNKRAKHENKNIFKPQNNITTKSYETKQTNELNMADWKNSWKSESGQFPSISEMYEEDGYSHSDSDKYHEEDEEVDYIGRAISANPPKSSSNYPGRLPPLQNQDKPGASKKKKRFLKKLASESKADV